MKAKEKKKSSWFPDLQVWKFWYHVEKEDLKGKKNKLLSWFQSAHTRIYTSIPSTKSRNFPNLILLNPLDYKIVLILFLITKIYSYNLS